MNDVSVIRVSRCEVTRGTLSDRHVLTLISKTMTGDLFKIVLNWAVLTQCYSDTTSKKTRSDACIGIDAEWLSNGEK